MKTKSCLGKIEVVKTWHCYYNGTEGQLSQKKPLNDVITDPVGLYPLCVMWHMSYVMCHMSGVCQMLQVRCQMSPLTPKP